MATQLKKKKKPAYVVIAAPSSYKFLRRVQMSLRKAVSETVNVIEVTIAFVLVFLVDLGAVEPFIVEFRRRPGN